jgi:FlaA1/EpsC-like NDP-sugar epimerase
LTAYRSLKSPVVYELKSALIDIKDLLSQDLPIQQDTASETAYGQTRRIFSTGGTANFSSRLCDGMIITLSS